MRKGYQFGFLMILFLGFFMARCGGGSSESLPSMGGDPTAPDGYTPGKADFAVSCSGWEASPDTLQKIEANLQIVVDKKHKLPKNYLPSDLIELSTVIPGLPAGVQLRQEAASQLAEMFRAAKEAGISNLTVLSSHRSFTTQCNTFSYWVNFEVQQGFSQAKAIERASSYSALPGSSEHQLGLALDITTRDLGRNVFNEGFDFIRDRKEGQWIFNNAWMFGFALSYPQGYTDCDGYQYESWHYRYLGVEAAKNWHDYYSQFIAYEYLRGESCAGEDVPDRPKGGADYQLPENPEDENSSGLIPPEEDPGEACAGLSIPDISTCKESWLLNCQQSRWDYCALGCKVAAEGEPDWCETPATKDPTLDPVAVCDKRLKGINTCGESINAKYPGWLLACKSSDVEQESAPEWIFCIYGCHSSPTGVADYCEPKKNP